MSETSQGLHPFRYHITASLVADSPLHVGTGEMDSGILPERTEDGQPVSPLLARTVRDFAGTFYLPGSTLKSLLRRASADEPLADSLFGEILVTEQKKGRMGSVLVWGARCLHAEPPGEAPYAKNVNGAFVAARTRIDPKRGVAAEHLLFFQEMIPAKSIFGLELLVVGDDPFTAKERAAAVLTILRRLEAGGTLGKGQTNGLGRVRVVPGTCKCEARILGLDGVFRAENAIYLEDEEAPAPETKDHQWRLKLRCPGPFIEVDPAVWTAMGRS